MKKKYELTDSLDLSKISKRISTSYAKFTKRREGSDDCVQSILCSMLEGKHQHSTIDQAVIDYLRLSTGRKGSKSYDCRIAFKNPSLFNPTKSDLADERNTFGDVDAGRISGRYLRYIGDGIDRGCFTLYHKWGLSAAEIGNIFGFGESRVSQRIQRVQSCLSKRINEEKSRSSVQGTIAVEGVLRSEAKTQLWGMGEITFERMETGQSFGVESFNEKSF